MPDTDTDKLYTYNYRLPKNNGWKFCPNCSKRLFEVLASGNFVIEIKCRSCKKVIQIKELQ